jgi:hypothetical protein
MMKPMYQACADIVKDLVSNEYLFFDAAVEIKLTPHSFPFHAWGVCVSPNDVLYIMDAEQEWHELTVEDRNAALVIGSLYQRLQMMRTKYAKAS